LADSPIAGHQNTGQADAGSDIFNGNLYVVGGYGLGANDRLDSVSVYSSGNGTWSVGPRYPVKAWGLACAALGKALYCFGGLGAGPRVFKLGGDVKSWTRLKDMPGGYNNSQGQVAIPDPVGNQILIMGSSNNLAVSNNTWAYQVDSDSYVRKQDMPQGNAWFTAGLFHETIYTFGGSYRFQPIGNMVFAYDINKDSWRQLSMKLPGPARYGMIRNPGVINGLVPIVDGYASGQTFYNLTYFYDFAKDSFFRGSDTLLPRDGIAGGIIGHDLLVTGGRNVRGSMLIPLMGLKFTEKLDLDPYLSLA
ncbi:MAG TPA: kelch repeat-containing protein, partial [Nitrososphaerales archaeon]